MEIVIFSHQCGVGKEQGWAHRDDASTHSLSPYGRMDNFSAHRTSDIDTLRTERNVYAAMYPENMTAHLQVLDLIVNGPIKRHIRACRSHELKC